MIVKSIILEIIEKICKAFLIVFIFLVIILVVLAKGIHVDNIRTPSAKINGLYIKLDKKLIVTVDEINLLKPNEDIKQSTDSLSSLDVILNKIPYLYVFFDTIDIKSLKYKDEEAKIRYSNKNMFIDTKYLTIQTKSIAYNDGDVELDFEELALKDYHLILNGKLKGSLHNFIYSFDGRYDVYEVIGDIKLGYKNNILTYSINSDEFDYQQFENLMDNIFLHVNLSEEPKSWIYKYIKAGKYKLISFDGKVDIKNSNIFPNEMKGYAVANDVNVTFNEKASAANVEKVEISFVKNELTILVKNGTYDDLKLNDSNVTISNIIGDKNSQVKINLFTNGLFEDSVKNILQAYDIKVPVSQISGRNDVYVGILVNVKPFYVDIVGDIEIFDSKFLISDVAFLSKHAKIELKNSTLNFYDSNIAMENLFDINANATLYADEGILAANATINNFEINTNNTTVVKIENTSTEAMMFVIDDGVRFEIDEYNTNLTFAKNNLLEFGSLEEISQFIPLANEYDIKNGSIAISTGDFENFYGLARVYDIKNIPLLYKNKTVDKFEGEFFISKDNLHARSFNDFFDININKELNVSIKNIDLVITNDMLKKDKDLFADNQEKQMPIHFTSQNASIIIEPINATVYANGIRVDIDEDKNIVANFYENNGFIDIEKSYDALNIYANDFTSSFVNNLIGREFFKGGNFNLYVEGNSTDYFNGIFSFTDSSLRDFALLNNIVAFLNTIPALATLSDPRYSSSGYPVKKGSMEFVRMDDFVYIQNVFLEGYSTDVSGLGYVELDTKKIYMDLEISTLKALSEIIDFIPLVNYIILGDDGKITIKLAVRGTYDNPKIETSMIEGAVKSPFNVIKRILLTPFRLFI